MNEVPLILYLLCPVEPMGVTVGYIDITVRLEDCQLEIPQDNVEQLATGCLKAGMQSVAFQAANIKILSEIDQMDLVMKLQQMTGNFPISHHAQLVLPHSSIYITHYNA